MEKEIYLRILKDKVLQAKLVLVTDKTFSTIWRWADQEDEKLTTQKATNIINEHLKGDSSIFLSQIGEILKNQENNK